MVMYEQDRLRNELKQANDTIAELRRELGASLDRETEITVYRANIEAELRAKLVEAEKLSEAISRDCNSTALERNSLRDELAKLRAAVPEKVQELINSYFYAVHDGSRHGDFEHARKVEQQLKDLIGSLITRSKGERGKEIIAAYLQGWDENFGKPQEKAEEYAERVLKGE